MVTAGNSRIARDLAQQQVFLDTFSAIGKAGVSCAVQTVSEPYKSTVDCAQRAKCAIIQTVVVVCLKWRVPQRGITNCERISPFSPAQSSSAARQMPKSRSA